MTVLAYQNRAAWFRTSTFGQVGSHGAGWVERVVRPGGEQAEMNRRAVGRRKQAASTAGRKAREPSCRLGNTLHTLKCMFIVNTLNREPSAGRGPLASLAGKKSSPPPPGASVRPHRTPGLGHLGATPSPGPRQRASWPVSLGIRRRGVQWEGV
jgi:hypothetical protein